MLIDYNVDTIEPPDCITFLVNDELLFKVNIKEKFPKYHLPDMELRRKYYISLNDNSLVFIENENEILKSLRQPTFGNINIGNNVYRKALLSDIDRNEEKYNSDNWKLYQYLNRTFSNYEIFLSEDKNIGIHIRKSDDEQDLILVRYLKQNHNFISDKKINMPYAVRELENCKSKNLREKYKELIKKNLEIPIISNALLPYVEGVFEVKAKEYSD